jgi:hypothetical protein
MFNPGDKGSYNPEDQHWHKISTPRGCCNRHFFPVSGKYVNIIQTLRSVPTELIRHFPSGTVSEDLRSFLSHYQPPDFSNYVIVYCQDNPFWLLSWGGLRALDHAKSCSHLNYEVGSPPTLMPRPHIYTQKIVLLRFRVWNWSVYV